MAKRQRPRDEIVTTPIAFNRTTYKVLRHLAVEEETNVRELIRRAIRDYLRRHPKGGFNR